MNNNDYFEVCARGRRKTATASARVRAFYKERKNLVNMVTVNDFILPDQYFSDQAHLVWLFLPLVLTEMHGKFDIRVRLSGGGKSGQAQAAALAIARGLSRIKPSCKAVLHAAGLLGTDSRQVERKHPGRKKARRSFQFSKR
jgi:small subunit ribosomal protein S9